MKKLVALLTGLLFGLSIHAFAEEVKPTEAKAPVKKAELVKRSGALSALGSLRSGKQRGGLNLGAVNTTAGVGLGGTGGSGGVQTSLYGKGITSAPLGPGANIAGGGGYGTKGKGGGQAGYGSLSLVGSSGGTPVPLGAEAEVASGLDRSAIDEVIRNVVSDQALPLRNKTKIRVFKVSDSLIKKDEDDLDKLFGKFNISDKNEQIDEDDSFYTYLHDNSDESNTMSYDDSDDVSGGNESGDDDK